MNSQLVMMAGLPGSGKSTLAQALAGRSGGVVLDKDRIRAALFPPSLVDYSSAQDDFCMDVLLATARHIVAQGKASRVFIDGRPFSRATQVEAVIETARALGCQLKVILCICSDARARLRLSHAHPAANRNYALYQRLQRDFEPLVIPHLEVNTDRPLVQVLAQTERYLGEP